MIHLQGNVLTCSALCGCKHGATLSPFSQIDLTTDCLIPVTSEIVITACLLADGEERISKQSNRLPNGGRDYFHELQC